MARGNKDLQKYSYTTPEIDLSKDENSNLIDLVKESFDCKRPDLNNPDDVNRAIAEYFERCNNHGVRPGNMGLYNALGLTRVEVNDILNGRSRKANPHLVNTLKKVKGIMAEYRETLGSQGKLSPPVLIFWQKNHDGFEDVQKVDVTADMPKPAQSPDEIAAEIEQDIPVDVTCSVTDADT